MVRPAVVNVFNREIISWAAVATAGISGSDVRDMLEVARNASVPSVKQDLFRSHPA
jgi:hypothetical protein